MDNFYKNKIRANRKKNEEVYQETCLALFGSVWTNEQLEEATNDQLISLMVTLKENVQLAQSPVDVKRLAKAIQNSRSGMGGCAMTNFQCAFCGETETWTSTAVPLICTACATEMAKKIALRPEYIVKDDASL